MAAVQMNVRIDEETKARGDEVFARWGLTPSQVVRAVWEYAEEKGEPPAFMRPARCTSASCSAPRKITCEDLREDEYFGKPKGELDDDEVHEAYYDDLRYEAYLEKASERGLL